MAFTYGCLCLCVYGYVVGVGGRVVRKEYVLLFVCISMSYTCWDWQRDGREKERERERERENA